MIGDEAAAIGGLILFNAHSTYFESIKNIKSYLSHVDMPM